MGKTQENRDRLLQLFGGWLSKQGFSLQQLLGPGEPDIEAINLRLGKYGRELFRVQGWPSLLRQEPPCHRLALPWQALLCLLSTSLSWGWTRVAGVIALSWGSLSRIGEVLSAARRDLILPSDVEFTISYGMLQIAEAKTRYRAARHQIAKIDQPQLLMVVSLAFEKLKPEFKLWPLSGQTMRSRFQRLLEACGLDRLPDNLSRGIDLGSLRAGGASWLLMVSEDSEMTRRRGRWISSKIMEIYVQEAWSIQFLHALPPSTKKTVLDGARAFPWLLEQAMKWHRALVPERIWFLLLRRLTEHELQLMGEDEFTLLAMTACVHHPSGNEEKKERERLYSVARGGTFVDLAVPVSAI